MTTLTPHDFFKHIRPDEVAECWDGVLDVDAKTEDEKWALYQALWKSMDDMKPLSEIIDIEDSCPQDAIGFNTVASVWDKFTPAQQERLNALAAALNAENAA